MTFGMRSNTELTHNARAKSSPTIIYIYIYIYIYKLVPWYIQTFSQMLNSWSSPLPRK